MDFALKYLRWEEIIREQNKKSENLLLLDKLSPFFLLGNKKAYNMFDFGNFLWGHATSRIGIPTDISLFGAQINEILYNNRAWDKDKSFFEYLLDTFHREDDPADQQAIIDGANYGK